MRAPSLSAARRLLALLGAAGLALAPLLLLRPPARAPAAAPPPAAAARLLPHAYWAHRRAHPARYRQPSCSAFPERAALQLAGAGASWQRLALRAGSLLLYAAHWDERAAPALVRVLVYSDVAPLPNITCLLWYEDRNAPEAVPATATYGWREGWGGGPTAGVDEPYVLACAAPPTGPAPRALSLVGAPCARPRNALAVQGAPPARPAPATPPAPPATSVAACIKWLEYAEDASADLAEWIELLRALGADKLYVYVLQVRSSPLSPPAPCPARSSYTPLRRWTRDPTIPRSRDYFSAPQHVARAAAVRGARVRGADAAGAAPAPPRRAPAGRLRGHAPRAAAPQRLPVPRPAPPRLARPPRHGRAHRAAQGRHVARADRARVAGPARRRRLDGRARLPQLLLPARRPARARRAAARAHAGARVARAPAQPARVLREVVPQRVERGRGAQPHARRVRRARLPPALRGGRHRQAAALPRAVRRRGGAVRGAGGGGARRGAVGAPGGGRARRARRRRPPAGRPAHPALTTRLTSDRDHCPSTSSI